jgi:hypothetical protein
MTPMNMIEFIGYAGSVIVLVSLLMKSLLKLRWINMVGSVLFATYGLLIHAWPVLGINAIIAGIDAWFLYQMLKASHYFDLSPLSEIGEEYFKKFFLYYENDIKQVFPGTKFEALIQAEAYMLFRNMIPVGFFAIELKGEEARVLNDYVVAEYRDFKTGLFVYNTKRMYFKQKGIKKFVAESGNAAHQKYLLRNGFQQDPSNADLFYKEL